MYAFKFALRVMQTKLGSLVKQIPANFHSWGLSGIIGILLESSSQNTDLFALDVVVECFKNPLEKFLLSVFIHPDNSIPIVCHLLKSLHLSQVNQGQHILLKAASSESDWAVEELGSNSTISGYASFDFLDISLILFTKNRNGVDGADSLGQKTIIDQFGEFWRVLIGQDHLIMRNIMIKTG